MDVHICLNKCNKCENIETEMGIIKDCLAWKTALEKFYAKSYISCGESFASEVLNITVPEWCPFFLEHLVAKKKA